MSNTFRRYEGGKRRDKPFAEWKREAWARADRRPPVEIGGLVKTPDGTRIVVPRVRLGLRRALRRAGRAEKNWGWYGLMLQSVTSTERTFFVPPSRPAFS